MARPRKSAEEHAANGTYRPSRHGPLPPPPADAAGDTPTPPAKPPGLSKTAGDFWDHVIRTRGNTLRPSDAHSLAVLAELHATWLVVLADVEQAKASDRMKLIQQLTTVAAGYERMARKFGLTPADRARIRPDRPPGPPAQRVQTRARTTLDRAGPSGDPGQE